MTSPKYFGFLVGSALWAECTNMGCGRLKVACEDGFEVVTKDQKELVAMVQWHTKNTHQKESSHDEVMKMAKHP